MVNFQSPKEFTDFIKISNYSAIKAVNNEELQERDLALINLYKNVPDRNYSETNTRYDAVISMIIERFYKIIPEQYVDLFKNHFHFSTCETETINAQIFRSPDKQHFAVLFNSSLIDLLTKIGKLSCASENPEVVEYCSRTPGRLPTMSELESMRKEYFEHFTRTKRSYGPFLILKKESAAPHFLQLDLQERFIVFHEIAHFLNGDLFEEENKASDHLLSYIDNRNHRKEYFADIVAFRLLLLSEQEDGKISNEKRFWMLLTIVSLFDTFYLLNSEESETHPLAIRRAYCITDQYYGETFTEILERSYGNSSVIRECFLILDKIDSLELYFDTIINELYKKAFDKENWV